MPTGTEHIVQKLIQLVEPVLGEMEFELVDAEYLRERGRWVMRLYIDREGGVTLEDCVNVSREIGDLIDVKEIVRHEYVLEVSSPGVNRPLKKEKDFYRVIGKRIKVRTFFPDGGRKNFTGHLEDLKDNVLYLSVDGKTMSIPLADIEKANLIYDFKELK